GQRRLALLRGELYRFSGEREPALRDLRMVRWPPESEESIAAALLEGVLMVGQGQPDEALQKYEEGFAVTARVLRQRAELRLRRGVIYVRQRLIEQAWREAMLARYEAEHLQGVVHEAAGNYQTAHSYFRAALALAEEASYGQGSALTHFHLAGLAGRRADIGEATTHLEEAMRYHKHTGDLFEVECVRCNLAAIRFQAQDYAAAADQARAALTFFERINHPYWIAVAASNLAEAYYELGELADAQQAASRVLEQEEPHTHPYALFTLGNIHRANQRYDLAEHSFRQALRLAEENEDKYISAYIWRAWSELYFEQGRQEEGQQAIESALALFEQMQMEQEVAATQKLAATSRVSL
ncbi:MAG: tetratricopeptide repeat protein, partial [Ardenticatenaceae bacterium]